MIHGIVGKNKMPLVSCQLSDKTEETYDLMWFMINKFMASLGLKWRADVKVHADFEVALRKAAIKGTATTDDALVGCTFHLGQALTRHADKNMKALRYKEGPEGDAYRTYLSRLHQMPLSTFLNQKLIHFTKLQYPVTMPNGLGSTN